MTPAPVPGADAGSAALAVAGVLVPVVTALITSTIVWRWFPWFIDSTRDLARLRKGPPRRGRAGTAVLLSARGRPAPAPTWVTGGTGLVLAWIVGMALPAAMTGTWADLPLLAGFGLVAGVTGWLAWIDAVVHRLPNRIVLPLGALLLACLAASLAIGALGPDGLDALWRAWALVIVRTFACGAALTAFFLIVALFGSLLRRDAMGLGDVKLAFPLGMIAGLFSPWGLLIALFTMNLSAVAELGLRWALTRVRPAGSLAFGPHMLIGTWTAVLVTGLLL